MPPAPSRRLDLNEKVIIAARTAAELTAPDLLPDMPGESMPLITRRGYG